MRRYRDSPSSVLSAVATGLDLLASPRLLTLVKGLKVEAVGDNLVLILWRGVTNGSLSCPMPGPNFLSPGPMVTGDVAAELENGRT